MSSTSNSIVSKIFKIFGHDEELAAALGLGLTARDQQMARPRPNIPEIWGVPFGVDPSFWGLQRVKRLG